MTKQLALTSDKTSKLTERQQHAHDILAEREATAEEIGVAWHAHRGRHAPDRPCDYCAYAGGSVLRSKALAPLVTYRNAEGTRIYRLRDCEPTAPRHDGYDPATSEIPF